MKFFYKYICITFFISIINCIYSPLSVGEISYTSLKAKDTKKLHIENCSPNIPANNTWKLIWHDEFNCLDRNKWNIEDWAAEKNNELQYYSPTNVTIKNGLLQITSKKEQFKGKEYTSGALNTKGKFQLLYGKVEMRAKLPAGQGIFPAFWMMTDSDNSLPEIDIMEMLGQKPTEIWMVTHWYTNRLRSDSTSFIGPDFSQDFHTFGIEWTPEAITWFIDGIERFRTNKSIPSEPMYLYINTAIGGNWPKSPDTTTTFPVHYTVDYVRVYTQEVTS